MGVSTPPAQSVVADPHQVRGSMTLPASFKSPRCRRTKLLFWFTREPQHKGSRPCNHTHYELTFTQHSQSVLRAKDMILMLLYGLEMFLCSFSLGRPDESLSASPSTHPLGLDGCTTPLSCGSPQTTTFPLSVPCNWGTHSYYAVGAP